MPHIAGLLLAAGSGRRYGQPKALVDNGSWLRSALDVLGGCDQCFVVVGASADEVIELVPPTVQVIRNPDHAAGLASSLRAGLQAIPPTADAVLVTLVDLPDVTAAVAARVLTKASDEHLRGVLARATYRGAPGHPVLIGAGHVAGVLACLKAPDAGAGRYLAANGAVGIPCDDLATGVDQDVPPAD